MTAHESEPTVLAKSLASGKRAEELNARLTAIFSNQINHELAPLRAEKIVAKRLDAWNMRAPMRKREFMRMLAPLRAAFQTLTPGVEDRLHSLSQAMEQFVTNAVISEA